MDDQTKAITKLDSAWEKQDAALFRPGQIEGLLDKLRALPAFPELEAKAQTALALQQLDPQLKDIYRGYEALMLQYDIAVHPILAIKACLYFLHHSYSALAAAGDDGVRRPSAFEVLEHLDRLRHLTYVVSSTKAKRLSKHKLVQRLYEAETGQPLPSSSRAQTPATPGVPTPSHWQRTGSSFGASASPAPASRKPSPMLEAGEAVAPQPTIIVREPQPPSAKTAPTTPASATLPPRPGAGSEYRRQQMEAARRAIVEAHVEYAMSVTAEDIWPSHGLHRDGRRQ